MTKMKDDIEKIKPKLVQNRNLPIAIINQEPADFDFADVDGTMKKITKKLGKWNTVSISQVLDTGCFSFETEFNSPNLQYFGIGIVRDSYNIPASANAANSPNKENMAIYGVVTHEDGSISYKGIRTEGNQKLKSNQIIKAEYDSEKGTLIIFVNGVQQPVYVSGIKEKIRFVVYMCHSGSICTIRSLKKLKAPTSGHVANEQAVQW
ncbi:MAG: hypothetical protein EZS28_026384 [Streblomastix strix]|uniref:SPRY domain-containing protein n=1 Tax=Streblomastix strix TaxID=222440 RepID=A0A5J4V6W1_9EUKA|nr:MAG: hypothetical protein EZS28_026384 [Streblomastix strix]